MLQRILPPTTLCLCHPNVNDEVEGATPAMAQPSAPVPRTLYRPGPGWFGGVLSSAVRLRRGRATVAPDQSRGLASSTETWPYLPGEVRERPNRIHC